nr:ZIP family metal transporter [Roseburia sp. OM04-10AA]
MIGIYIWIPFVGTFLGAACVLFMTGELKPLVQKSLLGFASGVMVAASVWSLLIPSLEMSEEMGRLSFIPAAVGFALGIAFLLILDRIIPHLHLNSDEPEGIKAHLKKTTMLVLAVTLHNIPEGMAVGVVFAGFLMGSGNITLTGALAWQSVLPYRIFRRVQLYPCHFAVKEPEKEKHFFTVHCPAL